MHENPPLLSILSPKIAFLLVSFSLGQLGDGLNIFQGIYLVGLGWNEGSVGTALSLMVRATGVFRRRSPVREGFLCSHTRNTFSDIGTNVVGGSTLRWRSH